jgi:hypothetical protein
VQQAFGSLRQKYHIKQEIVLPTTTLIPEFTYLGKAFEHTITIDHTNLASPYRPHKTMTMYQLAGLAHDQAKNWQFEQQ